MDAQTLNQAVTDSYVSLLKVKAPDASSVTLVLKNTDSTNDLDYQILVSNDPQGTAGSWDAVDLDDEGTVEGTLGQGETQSWDLPLYHWYDVQVKNTVAESAAEASAWMHVKG